MTVAGLAEVALLPSPFRGLSPFGDSELDALLFFGREREAEVIAANMMAARLTVLYGASGVGKTSVLRAGMAQRLRALARDNLRDRGAPELAVAIVDSWSGDAVEAIVRAASEAVSDALGEDDVDLGEGTLVERLGIAADLVGGDFYLVLDQFEEYFLYHDEDVGEDTLNDAFPELVVRGAVGVNVLVGIREDALAHLDIFKAKVPGLFANSLRLDWLDRRSARAAILGPVDAYNRLVAPDEHMTVEPELVEAVLDQVTVGRIDHGRSGRGAAPRRIDRARIEAPYLQLVLLRVWDTERGEGSTVLRRATLERLGGAQRIVENHLQDALDSLSDEARVGAAAAFRHLVTPSGTKIAHRSTDLARYAGVDEREMQSLLSALAAQRIVRPLGGDSPEGDRYEIYHDVLTEAVLAWRTRFEAGRQLEQERREASRRQRRLASLAVVSLAALVVMAAVTVFALRQRSVAEERRTEARGRELVARAASTLVRDPRGSLALALEAAGLDANEGVENALRSALAADRQRAVIPHGTPVEAASVSPDGRLAATGDEAGRVRIVRALSGDVVRTLTFAAPVSALGYAPDGALAVAVGAEIAVVRPDGERARTLRQDAPVGALDHARDGTLATGGADGRIRVYGTADEPVAVTPSLGSQVRDVAFSPDGSRVLAVATGGRAAVFDARSGVLSFGLDRPAQVLAADWSPGGRLIATGGPDHLARVWTAATGKRFAILRGHRGPVGDVSFSPRGSLLVTASTDGTARIWNISREASDAQLVGHTNHVLSAMFSPDGFLVATTSHDRTARIWQSSNGSQLARLIGHADSVSGAAFAAAGHRLLTWSPDGTARLWDPVTQPDAPVVRRIFPGGTRAAFARGGTLVAVVGADAVARVWGPDGPPLTVRVPGGVSAVDLTADGRLVAAGGRGGTARVVRLGGRGAETLELPHGGRITAIALDPAGELALTAGADGTARLWRVADGASVRAFDRIDRHVRSAALSSNGRFAALGDARGDAYLLDVQTGRVVHTLRGHRDDVASVAFSPDDRRLVTASRDRDARVWNVETGSETALLRVHFAAVDDARFSPDQRWIVTASRGGTAALWPAGSDQHLGFVRGTEGAVLSATFTADSRRIRTVGADGSVRELRCPDCGGVPVLRALAEARLEPREGSRRR